MRKRPRSLKVGRTASLGLLPLALVIALAMSACGPNSASTGTASGTSISPAVAAAKATYEKYVKAQPPISIPILPTRPPTDKTIAIMTCNVPVCAGEADPEATAAKLLHWKVTFVTLTSLTPQAYLAAVNEIVQLHPNFATIVPILPDSFITTQLTELQKAGTKVVEAAGTITPSSAGPVEGVVAGAPQLSESGALMGDAVVANSQGDAQVAFVWDPTLANSFGPIEQSFIRVVKGAGGTVDIVDISESNVGRSVPGQIVSYVQAHPSVKFVAFALSDYLAGVPQALATAGLSGKVKIISRDPEASNMADVANGSEWAEVAEEEPAAAFRAVDLFARMAMGISPGDLANTGGWHQIFIRGNVKEVNAFPPTPGFPQAFLKAWHIS
jgi:hypothetical protein